jgi:hypothetical protein
MSTESSKPSALSQLPLPLGTALRDVATLMLSNARAGEAGGGGVKDYEELCQQHGKLIFPSLKELVKSGSEGARTLDWAETVFAPVVIRESYFCLAIYDADSPAEAKLKRKNNVIFYVFNVNRDGVSIRKVEIKS